MSRLWRTASPDYLADRFDGDLSVVVAEGES